MHKDVLIRINDLVNIPAQPEKKHIYKSGANKGKIKVTRARAESKGLVGVGKTTLWRWIKIGFFPKPIKVSERVVAWRLSEVEKWLDERAQDKLEA